MTDKNRERRNFSVQRMENGRIENAENDLGTMLDAALAKYAAIEPWVGLEERILACLRAERSRVVDRAWWQWAVAATTVAVVVAFALAWRLERQPQLTHHPVVTTQSPPAPQMSNHSGAEPLSHRRNPSAHGTNAPKSSLQIVMTANPSPKLDQFPSPEPLSEQEKILASYVAEYPERAVLVARAQAESLLRDQQELEDQPEQVRYSTNPDDDLPLQN